MAKDHSANFYKGPAKLPSGRARIDESEGTMQAISNGVLALQSDGDSSVAAKGAVNIEAKQNVAINGMNAAVEGKQNVDMKGGVQANVSGSMTCVKGAAFKIDVM